MRFDRRPGHSPDIGLRTGGDGGTASSLPLRRRWRDRRDGLHQSDHLTPHARDRRPLPAAGSREEPRNSSCLPSTVRPVWASVTGARAARRRPVCSPRAGGTSGRIFTPGTKGSPGTDGSDNAGPAASAAPAPTEPSAATGPVAVSASPAPPDPTPTASARGPAVPHSPPSLPDRNPAEAEQRSSQRMRGCSDDACPGGAVSCPCPAAGAGGMWSRVTGARGRRIRCQPGGGEFR